MPGADMEREYYLEFFRRSPKWLPHRMPYGLGTIKPIEQPAAQSQPSLADPVDLIDRGADRMRRNIGHSDQSFGIVLAKLGDEVVIGTVRRRDHFRIFDAVFDEANAVDDFRFHAVNVEVLEAELGVRRMGRFPSDIHHSFAAIAGEAASSHPATVGSHDGSISNPDGDAVDVDDLGNLVLQTGGGARRKRIGRKKKEIEMTIGRYDFSVHINSRAAA